MVMLIFVLLFFALAYAATWNLCRGGELGREERTQPEDTTETQVEAPIPCEHGAIGLCLPCAARLRRTAESRREVVCQLERLIGSETAAVNRILRQPDPENIHHLYLN